MPDSYASDPALTYTLDQFIAMQYVDEVTYRNFAILEVVNGIELLDHNLVDDYLSELESICVDCELTLEQQKRYKYAPDLLAYDVYGSTQLDFVILLANDMIDTKEFNLKVVRLPYKSAMTTFMSSIYNANASYVSQNRSDNNLNMY